VGAVVIAAAAAVVSAGFAVSADATVSSFFAHAATAAASNSPATAGLVMRNIGAPP
jgi:hypothetical protein